MKMNLNDDAGGAEFIRRLRLIRKAFPDKKPLALKIDLLPDGRIIIEIVQRMNLEFDEDVSPENMVYFAEERKSESEKIEAKDYYLG